MYRLSRVLSLMKFARESIRRTTGVGANKVKSKAEKLSGDRVRLALESLTR